MHCPLHIRTMNHSHFPVVLGVGEPPPQQRQKFTIERIALVNWKNGTKTLFWQEEEGNHEGGSGQLFVVWCLGNAFTCKVKAKVNLKRFTILLCMKNSKYHCTLSRLEY